MSSLNGFTLAKARRFLSKGILPLISGFYTDVYWQGPQKVWDYLRSHDIDYGIVSANYKHNADYVPISKEWQVEIAFVDDKGKDRIIRGLLTAHGAGSVKDPLDAYDLTMSIF